MKQLLTNRSVQPQFIGSFVDRLSANTTSTSDDDAHGMRVGYIYGVSIIACSVLSILINHPFNLYIVKLGMEIRLVCCSMIYRKVSNAIHIGRCVSHAAIVCFHCTIHGVIFQRQIRSDFAAVKGKRVRRFQWQGAQFDVD